MDRIRTENRGLSEELTRLHGDIDSQRDVNAEMAQRLEAALQEARSAGDRIASLQQQRDADAQKADQSLLELRREVELLKQRAAAERKRAAEADQQCTQLSTQLRAEQDRAAAVVAERDEERHRVAEAEKSRLELELAARKTKAKSREVIILLQRELEAERQHADSLEAACVELRRQLEEGSLVQAELVQYSKKLAVGLERARERASMVHWQNDEDVTQCRGCRTAFGLMQRKHHCRVCGQIFCGNCSNKALEIPGTTALHRVCDRVRAHVCRGSGDARPCASRGAAHPPAKVL